MDDLDLREFAMQPAEYGGGEVIHKECDKVRGDDVLYFEGGVSFVHLIAAARLHNIKYHGTGE